VLESGIGQASDATLYGCVLVTSLFFGALTYSLLGAKLGLGVSLLTYAAYSFIFAAAAQSCAELSYMGSCLRGNGAQGPLAISGAIIGGLGGGTLWTCQGAFLASVVERVASAEARPRTDVSAELAGTFGSIFLFSEALTRALATVLIKYAGLSYAANFVVMSAIALAGAVLFLVLADIGGKGEPFRASQAAEKLVAAVALWRDPKFWLLQLTNVTFGFASAWLGGWIGRHIIAVAMDGDLIGFAGAILSLTAALLSKWFGRISVRLGKIVPVSIGATAFFLLGLLSYWVGHPQDWGSGTLVFYVLMGIGRATFESTNKAIFVDFFPPEQHAGAFANVMVFSTGSSTVAFVLGAFGRPVPEVLMLVACAALTVPAFLAAGILKRREDRRLGRSSLVSLKAVA